VWLLNGSTKWVRLRLVWLLCHCDLKLLKGRWGRLLKDGNGYFRDNRCVRGGDDEGGYDDLVTDEAEGRVGLLSDECGDLGTRRRYGSTMGVAT